MLHYVNQEFVPTNSTIGVREFPEIHDGDSVAAVIEQILVEWMLLKRFSVMFVGDGGSNMVSACNKRGLKHVSCIAHSLHLVVAEAPIKENNPLGLLTLPWKPPTILLSTKKRPAYLAKIKTLLRAIVSLQSRRWGIS